MNDDVRQAVVAAVVQTVSESPQKSALGTRIVKAVRAIFPQFSPQNEDCRSFREFIRNFVPQVSESSERAGMDIIYVLKAPTIPANEHPSTPSQYAERPAGFVSLLLNNPRAWKTFASPLSTSHIYVNRSGSQVQVSSAHSVPPSAEWLRIGPISAASLLRIAQDFIELVPDLYKSALTDCLAKPKWWIPYFEVMGSLGLKSRWVAFRRRRILDEFVKAVTASAADVSTDRGRGEHNVAPTGLSTPQAEEIQRPERIPGEDEARLRNIALAVVNQMTISELKALVVPLGYVAHALDQLS